MTSKQRAYLRSLAMTMSPTVIIGKSGLTESVISEVDTCLENKELIKVTLLKNSECDVVSVANALAESTNSILVQTVGSKITLYRVSKKDNIKHIVLPC